MEDLKIDRSWLFETKRDFAERWNLNLKDDKFYERCIELVGRVVSNIDNFNYICNKGFLVAGETNKSREIITKRGFALKSLQDMSREEVKDFSDTALFSLLKNKSSDENFLNFIEILEIIFNECLDREAVNHAIIQEFNDVAVLSNKSVKLVFDDSDKKYKFYPSNVELFDKKLIDDVLDFLKDYPKAHKELSEALVIFLKQGSYRDAVDKTRLALELFLKQFLNNEKSLEKQIEQEHLGKYLKGNGINSEITNMFEKLLDCYGKLINEKVKHDSTEFKKSEVEFLFYLVGNFIKFFIEVKNYSELKK